MTAVRVPARLDRGALTLRLWEPSDAPAMHDAIQDNLDWLADFMPWVADEPLPMDARLALIQGWREMFDKGGDAVYGIFLGGAVAGGCGLHQRLGPGALEIGYWVAQRFARRRVAATTAALLTSAALAADGIDRAEIHHAEENFRSQGVPRLLGYRQVGVITGEPPVPGLSGVSVVWRMVREELDLPQLAGFTVRDDS